MATIGWHFTMPSLEVYMDSADETTDKKPDPKVAYIGEGVIFKGELSAPELVVIDGSVEGEVSARCVRVGVSGSLKGTVTVTDADIQGTVSDKLEVKQLLIVRATGRVDANISYGQLQIEKGAVLTGELSSTDVRSKGEHISQRAKLSPVANSTPTPTLELKRAGGSSAS
jgi:cytoskeletal protein CcmA (bactofilin family)